MKIGQPSDVTPATAQTSQAATAKTAQAATPAAKSERKAPPGVGVTVSSLARALEQADAAPEVDMDKVNAMRQAIEQNTFVVNPEAISDKLLANAQEMLKRSSS